MNTKQLFATADTCVCGRQFNKRPHCPACGGVSVYAKRANSICIRDRNSADVITYEGFKCRGCGLDFHTGMPCEAPPNESMKEVRQMAKAREKVDEALASVGGDRMKLLRKLAEEQGYVKKPSNGDSEVTK